MSNPEDNWSSKNYTWITDKEEGYIAGRIISQEGDNFVVELDNGDKRTVHGNDLQKMNPPKFDKVEDMADLTHLNEASVVHNLRLRYHSNLIYTYSGLFLVAVNPYFKINIYNDQYIQNYKVKNVVKQNHTFMPHQIWLI